MSKRNVKCPNQLKTESAKSRSPTPSFPKREKGGFKMSGALFILLVILFNGCHEKGYNNKSQGDQSDDYSYVTPPPTYQPDPNAPPSDIKLPPEIKAIPDEEEADEIFMIIEELPEINFNTEEYDRIYENDFVAVWDNPLSTFSIDVDNASYSNVRRFLTQYHELPPPDAVRIEELVNYFSYEYPQPKGEHPFALVTEVAQCPWNPEHQLLHLGIQGKSLDYEQLSPSNLVFLVDVSGSMDEPNKLPLVQKSLRLLIDALKPTDRVAMVVYAGAAGMVLPSTPASDKDTIFKALDNLQAGGSTAGGAGIQLAYQIAKENFIADGNNRVILATDGDFNIGTSSTGDLVRMIEEKRKQDIYLTICGFGMGNYKDGRMEQISNAGNGNYFYIDHIQEAEKVFVRELRANLFTIAKDVKIQLEFNPQQVQSYRLIGYENRLLSREDFDDDLKDAGELGAGHTVTALYEIIPTPPDQEVSTATALRYQQSIVTDQANANELLTFKLRYKPIGSKQSLLIEQPVRYSENTFAKSSQNFRLSATVAGFGMLLRQSQYSGTLTFKQLEAWLHGAKPTVNTDWQDFEQLLRTATLLNDPR
ncbi:vWA domain-containing protein [Tunicatimonas pelagia]|uniref:vWA domain-containing protein n=1 Tax=Tunicatimonas pelagia TaxID=931531 RepID=UPI0026651BE1|nr:VWA domain-containing protein [Tunicatimonas pelagia]WKN45503.1 VWA domain-containing protein [Tunicatimonas pelagia]